MSKQTGGHQIRIGPILISQNLTKDVHADFVYCIQKIVQVSKTNRGHLGLMERNPEGFSSAKKLRRMNHFRSNVKEHLKVRDESNKSEIKNQIFGYHTGDGIYDEGIVDADSSEMFDSLYESATELGEEVPYLCQQHQ